MMNLTEQLKRDEGLRLKPYYCPAGKLTIGVGRNIEDNGISEAEAMMMLDNDIFNATKELEKALPWFKKLDKVRQEALINMNFNMGLPKLLGFEKTLSFIEAGEYDKASVEALDSNAARDLPVRYKRISEQIRTGVRQ